MLQKDYSPVSKLLIAYPERFYNVYDELVPFYDELISLLPNDLLIWVITNNQQSISKIEKNFQHKKIKTLGIKGWDEIWLRDCIGIVNGNSVIKPRYAPQYCFYQSHEEYLIKINKLSRKIIKECLEKDVVEIELKMDGGNFVCNNEFAFITDKVCEQNPHLTKKEIEALIEEKTGLIPVILPCNKNDSIGHTDAYISFLEDKKVAIATYPSFPFLKDDIDFINSVENRVLQLGIETIKMYDRPIFEAAECGCSRRFKKPCFYSARGNYLNFLRINNLIILPEYKLGVKKESNYYNNINQEILEFQGFEVRRINCDLLSKLGGVLHCISFTS